MTPEQSRSGIARAIALFEAVFVGLNRWAVIFALAGMACIVFSNVTLRYFTNHSIVWAEEVSRYLMVYMAFLSAGLALRQGMLVAVSHLHLRFAAPVARAVRGVMLFIMLGFCLWMVYAGLEYMGRMGRQVTPATRISFAWIYWAMPMGFGMMAVHLLLLAPRFLTEGRFESDDNSQPTAVGG